MPNLTISIPSELYRKLKKHPEINWSVVIRNYLEDFIRKLEAKYEEEATELLGRLGLRDELSKIPSEKAIEFGNLMMKKRAKRVIRY